MPTSDSERRYVNPLLSWAQASRSDRKMKRDFLDPQHEFWPWLRSRVHSYYCSYYGPPAEFYDECALRLLLWARNNIATLDQPAFNDGALTGVLRTIAKRLRIDTLRKKKVRRLESLDHFFEEWENRHGYLSTLRRAWPERLRVPPLEWGTLHFPHLQEEFEHARFIVPQFGRQLRGQSKMRQLLAALLMLGRRLGKVLKISGHWFVFRLLRARARHLPHYVRCYLRRKFAGLRYNVINARLGYLRRSFHEFALSLN